LKIEYQARGQRSTHLAIRELIGIGGRPGFRGVPLSIYPYIFHRN